MAEDSAVDPSPSSPLLSSAERSPTSNTAAAAAAAMDQQEQQQHEQQQQQTAIDPHFPRVERPSVYRRRSFLVEIASTPGPQQIMVLVIMVALGAGATIGVVPAVMTDRFARLNHHYTMEEDCSDFTDIADKPEECLLGSGDAQNYAAYSSLVNNVLTFLTSSLMGSLSDEYGRRGILLLGLFLYCLSPITLVLVQVVPTVSPIWYYAGHAITGLISWIAISLSAISDVLPPKWRAPGFGLLLAAFSIGLSLAPTLALAMSHLQISVLSSSLTLTSVLYAFACFPETLPARVRQQAIADRREGRRRELEGSKDRVLHLMLRPLRELSILNRNTFFRLLSSLAFFSGMVSAADQTLLLYYLEERLAFNDHDVATLFLLIGSCNILVQSVLLKPLNDKIGERYVVIVAFLVSALVNVLYGLARQKSLVFTAAALASLGSMAFPTISALKSINVHESEQGRVQGALYSLQALAAGVGPMVLRIVYRQTQGLDYPGPGYMFIAGGVLYFVAVGCGWALPKDQANSANHRDGYEAISVDGHGGGSGGGGDEEEELHQEP